MIGLTGAHQTGKTTLAKRYAELTKIPFVATGATAVFEKLGLDPKADYPFDVRLGIQKHILEAAQKLYRDAGAQFVTDRTPLDYLAYTLADVHRTNLTEQDEVNLKQYMKDCFTVCNCHFSTLLVVQPGIHLIDRAVPGKARADFAYVEHIANLIMGLVVHEDIEAVHYFIPRAMTDLDRRVRCIDFSVKRSREKFDQQIVEAVDNGLYIH